MYILKNALRCVKRSIGRNILIGLIVLIIAVASCLGLSIREASRTATESALSELSITATISYDRSSAMDSMMGGGIPGQGFNPESNDMSELFGGNSLTLDEYKKYSDASSVSSFYYLGTAYLNGSDGFSPVSDETDSSSDNTSQSNNQGRPSRPGGGFGEQMFGSQSDFTVIGYSSEAAMTDFIKGTSYIYAGSLFEDSEEAIQCIIPYELALFNGIDVGTAVTVTNPNNEEESYTLTVVGIYKTTESSDNTSALGSVSQDPANRILMSYSSLSSIISSSEKSATDVENEIGFTYSTALTCTLSATYTFSDIEDYELFTEQVYDMGLDEKYTVTSNDVSAYKNSLVPLNTLSTMAGWFLVVIVVIGGAILVVLNIFNVRERKYEIGVLTAMGMKKYKVATQFILETLAVSIIAVFLGAVIGAVSSIPVTNTLLENQISSQENKQSQIDDNFGRGEMPGGNNGGFGNMTPPSVGNNPSEGNNFRPGDIFGKNSAVGNYINEVDSAMNLTVLIQLIGIGILLTLVASAASVVFVMRYDPLKILSNRD